MRFIKPVLWTVLGVVIGASASLAASRVQAQQKPADRIQVNFAGADRSGNYGIYFVKDKKSGGCWIGTRDGSNWTGLAVAPNTACD
jgi:hypothetical protein